jgi:hypothetical protein
MSRPVCWHEAPADENAAPTKSEGELLSTPPETTPTESPGVFVEQPFERWSPRDLLVGPRDLVMGMARRLRWAGAGVVRSEAAS